jgi:hypothetical protein
MSSTRTWSRASRSPSRWYATSSWSTLRSLAEPPRAAVGLRDRPPATGAAVVSLSTIASDISDLLGRTPGLYPRRTRANVSSAGSAWNQRASNEEGRSGMYIGGGVILLILIIILLIYLL